MLIRKLCSYDYDEVYSLWLSCRGMGINSVDDAREAFERFVVRNPETALAAELDGRIVGTILAGFDGRRGYIYHTAVHPDFRRQGIATALLEQVLSELGNMGAAKVGLLVYCDNDAGNSFWDKHGFFKRDDVYFRNKEIADIKKL